MKETHNKNAVFLTIYEIVADYYYDFKAIAERETRKFNTLNKDLDEDMFHSGLLRMVEALEHTRLTLKDAKGYWCNLYKNALLRSCMYARVKYKSDGEFNASLFKTKDDYIDCKIDLECIMADIEKNFTKDDYNIFTEAIEGKTLKELNEKYDIKNSDYRIRKIKKYIKEEYPEIIISKKCL